MKTILFSVALALSGAMASGSALASEEQTFDCGDQAAGLIINVIYSPELGKAVLEESDHKTTLKPEGDGVWRGESDNISIQFFPPDYDGDIMGDPPPVLLLESEQFSCTKIADAGGRNQSAGTNVRVGDETNTPGLSFGGKLRAGPGLSFKQVGSAPAYSPLTILRNTGVTMDGYDWFEVQMKNGLRAFQWGGIMCSDGGFIGGIYTACPTVSGGTSGSPGWMAFALTPEGKMGHGSAPTRGEAETYSLQYCGQTSCRVVNVTREACQAIAQSGGHFSFGADRSKLAAEQKANASCQAGSPGNSCRIAYSFCRN